MKHSTNLLTYRVTWTFCGRWASCKLMRRRIYTNILKRISDSNIYLTILRRLLPLKFKTYRRPWLQLVGLLHATSQLVTGISRNQRNTATIRDTLHWHPRPRRSVSRTALMAFVCVQGQGPEYLSDVLVSVHSVRTRASRLQTTTTWFRHVYNVLSAVSVRTSASAVWARQWLAEYSPRRLAFRYCF